MALVVGSDSGIYHGSRLEGPYEKVLKTDGVMRITEADGTLYAASQSGLLVSTDGRAWDQIDTPQQEVYAVAEAPDTESLYIGTHPAHIYESDDRGDRWTELEGFQDLPSRDSWHTPRHRNSAHVRSLEIHPDAPNRLIAGVEVGGAHVSEDRGTTWTERREGLHDDVHHLLVVDRDRWVAATGNGLYRTDDAGRSWARLDRELTKQYFRESILHDGVLYTAAAAGSPPQWSGDSGAEAAVFESPDMGETLNRVDTPVTPSEIVLAWTSDGDTVIGGTNAGTVIRRTGEGWERAGSLPVGIRSIHAW
jgi:photosystem II stability/assembly factor-like uncharacterized protein